MLLHTWSWDSYSNVNIQISFAATASSLSEKSNYPFFLRTVASDLSVPMGIVALMKQFNWNRIGTINQQEDAFTRVHTHTRGRTFLIN